MKKPRLLDTFCKAGGASMGYYLAGFEVVGADIEVTSPDFIVADLFSGAGGAAFGYLKAFIKRFPHVLIIGVDEKFQPRYPSFHNKWYSKHFLFVQADALEYIAEYGHEFDIIHASPPCQRFSEATPLSHRDNHLDLIGPTREVLQKVGRPYVIENVEGARAELINPIKLCGSMLGLPIWRHRYFEIYPNQLFLTPPCNHCRKPIRATINNRERLVQVPVLCTGGGDGKRSSRKTHRPRGKVEEIRWAMEIGWMVQKELTEAIPPAYAHWIGKRIIKIGE